MKLFQGLLKRPGALLRLLPGLALAGVLAGCSSDNGSTTTVGPETTGTGSVPTPTGGIFDRDRTTSPIATPGTGLSGETAAQPGAASTPNTPATSAAPETPPTPPGEAKSDVPRVIDKPAEPTPSDKAAEAKKGDDSAETSKDNDPAETKKDNDTKDQLRS